MNQHHNHIRINMFSIEFYKFHTYNFSLQNPGVLGFIFEKLVIAMILYFLLSIVNSLAQSYHKRLHKKKQHGE